MAPLHTLLMRLGAACLALAAAAPAATAGETPEPLRPVEAAYTVSVGSGHIADTYLSPLRYSGQSLSLDYERRQAMRFDPDRWTMRLAGSLAGMHTTNPAGTVTTWGALLRLQWAMTRIWRITPRVSAAIGPGVTLLGGCLYNERNTNNPCSAKASCTADISGYATWHGSLGRMPLAVTLQASMPVTGVFFAPQYGELYYEIYMGRRSGLARCAWWGNYTALQSQLTADLPLGRATHLRLGMRADWLSTRASHITTRVTAFQFIIGVSGSWLSIDPRKPLNPDARIITASY